jgi:hypothetical protein
MRRDRLAMAGVVSLVAFGVGMAVWPDDTIPAESVRTAIADELTGPGTALGVNACETLLGSTPADERRVAIRRVSDPSGAGVRAECALRMTTDSTSSASGSVRHFSELDALWAIVDDDLDHESIALDRSCPSGAVIWIRRNTNAGEESHRVASAVVKADDGAGLLIQLESSDLHPNTLRIGVEEIIGLLSVDPIADDSCAS